MRLFSAVSPLRGAATLRVAVRDDGRHPKPSRGHDHCYHHGDSGPGSLRAAIAAASNGDTIQFDAALNGQSITLTSGKLAIDKNITIDGPGANQLAVKKSSGAPDFRIFHVMPGHTFIIEGLTIDGNGTWRRRLE